MTATLALTERWRRAAGLGASPWMAAAALAAGALVAGTLVAWLPAGGGDVEAARALGIVSVTTLAGYSKSAESLAYGAGVASALATSLGLWLAWAARAGRDAPAPATPAPAGPPRVRAFELAILALALVLPFVRPFDAHEVWISPWFVLAEEGELLAWVDVVLRGGALSRDTFCLYGPLSTWPVAWLFDAFGPSLGVWRRWIFALNAPALVAIWFLLRGLVQSRGIALAGTAVIALLCAPTVPAFAWSLSRVGLALGAVACLGRALARGAPAGFLATGALLGVTLLYSQEVGLAGSVAVGVTLLLRPDRVRELLWTGLGGALALAPAILYIASRGALAATFDNLFLFPRTRLLGFGALPFPGLAATGESLRAWFTPVMLVATGFVPARRVLCGQRDPRTLTELALLGFGLLLFSTPLSRPDEAHVAFALPPALALLCARIDAAGRWRGSVAGSARFAPAIAVALALVSLAPWLGTATKKLDGLLRSAPAGLRPLALPRGGGVLLPPQLASDIEDVTRAIQARTAPGEPFWAYPNEALLYFLADRPQPTHFPLLVFAVTRAQRAKLLSQLERTRPRYAVVHLAYSVLDGITHDVVAPEVVAYLAKHYQHEARFGSFAILRRK